MYLQPEGGSYKVFLDRDDRRPVTESCRESIQIIASSGYDPSSREVRFTDDGIEYTEILARIAISANTGKGEPVELTPHELTILEKALGNFSTAEYIKKAVHEEVQRSGVLSNPRLESRVDLGRRAGLILKELVEQRADIDNDPRRAS